LFEFCARLVSGLHRVSHQCQSGARLHFMARRRSTGGRLSARTVWFSSINDRRPLDTQFILLSLSFYSISLCAPEVSNRVNRGQVCLTSSGQPHAPRRAAVSWTAFVREMLQPDSGLQQTIVHSYLMAVLARWLGLMARIAIAIA
jgi:hypothetical protein